MDRRNKRWPILVIVILASCLLISVVVGGGWFLLRRSPSLHAAFQEPPPVVRFLAPYHGDEVVVGSTVAVEVEAAAPGGQVSLLQVWADGVLVGEMPASAEAASGSWGWLPLLPGDHTLVARAYNRTGDEGVAVVRVRAVEAADADRDGVSDETDACPERAGLIQLEGCPPGMANGVPPSDPEMQEIVERWVPPEVGGEQLGGAAFPEEEAAPGEGAPPEEEGGPSEEGAPPEEEGAAAEEGVPLWPGRKFPPSDRAVGRNCPLCSLWEGLLERETGEGQVFTDAEGSGTAVGVEVNQLRTARGWSGVYCYVRLAGEDWTAVPDSQQSLWPTGIPGFWDVEAVLGGGHSRVVTIPEGSPLRLEMECLGRTDDPTAEPQYLGHLVREHGPADWNGQPIVARAQAGGNWFEVTYRFCGGTCEEDAIPAPYALRLRTERVGGETLYGLSWRWNGDREQIDGFNVYLCYHDSGNCFQIEQTPFLGVHLDEDFAVPPCGRIHRFEVRAFRQTEHGIEESAPSPPAWASSPAVCRGDNRLALKETWGPTRYRAMMGIHLEYHYIGDHGDRVTVFAYPLKDGEPDPSFFWRSATIYSEAEDGETTVRLYYAGTERHTTDGLRLVMVSEDGDPFYEQDVAYPVEWYPSQPDLAINLVKPINYTQYGLEVRGEMYLIVQNRGDAPVWRWDGQLQIRLADGRVLSHPNPSAHAGPLLPDRIAFVRWPWWHERSDEMMNDLLPSFQVVVDPDNTVAELDETNNVYEATPLRVRVVWDKMKAYHDPDLGADFVGLEGELTARVGDYRDSIEFDGAAHDDWCCARGWCEYEPYEIGIGIVPSEDYDRVYDFGDQIFPAITQLETCLALEEENIFFIDHSEWCAEIQSGEEECERLAEQGFAPERDWVEIPVWPGHNLLLLARLYDMDYEYQWWPPTAREELETVCNVRREVTPDELANLPLEVTLGSPEEGCEIIVQIQPVP